MSGTETFRSHLKRVGADYDELIAKIDAIAPGVAVVAMGSIPHGRGSPYSDIDILLVGDRAEADIRAQLHFDHGFMVEHPMRLSTGHEVEVGALVANHARDIAARLAETTRLMANPQELKSGIPLLDEETYLILDDVANGVALRGADAFETLKAELSLTGVLDCVLLLTLIDHFVTREDAISHLERASNETALLMIRSSVDKLSQAMLASAGNANTRLQWRLPFLDQYRDRLGDDVVDSLRQLILRPATDPAEAKAAFQAFVQFADAQIAAILGRRADLVPAFMTLSQFQQFQMYTAA